MFLTFARGLNGSLFPSLSYLAENRYQALEGITNLVQEVVADLEINGEEIPEPISQRSYSGKFQVRIPPELHRKIVLSAFDLANFGINGYYCQ
jgi:predicted HicB family RNase H-like nuclease